jgi:hypothetical protein
MLDSVLENYKYLPVIPNKYICEGTISEMDDVGKMWAE